jgi:hypothetical protein
MLWPVIAQAAELTEMPPALRGDLGVRFDTYTQHDRLTEQEEVVGRRVLATTQLTIGGQFSFIDGAGLFFDIPRYTEQTRYPEANLMAFDPLNDTGTMLGTAALSSDAVGLSGKGFGGTWLGLSGTPLSEQLFSARGDLVSWRIDAAYRFADKTPFWTFDTDRQVRGAGPGASAFRLRTAASTTHRNAQPYIAADLIRSSRQTLDVINEDGVTLMSNVEILPASSADIITGAELFVYKNADTGSQISLDFRSSFGYRSFQTLPSGTYLPSILDASRTVLSTMAEQTYLDLGFGLNSRIQRYVQLNVGGEVGTVSPHRIEHLYTAETGLGSLSWQVHAELRFRARDPLVEQMFATE